MSPLAAQPPKPPPIDELIILVAADAGSPSPEEIVDAVNDGTPIPGGFEEGDPYAARTVITRRATGATRQWMLENPDTPLARLERYIVLTYPGETDLGATMEVLTDNPNAENVEENRWLRLASSSGPDPAPLPSDPLVDPSSGDPSLHQWGTHALNLPEAWQCAKGHASVGLVDTGLQVDHPDLRAHHRELDDTLVFDGGNFRAHLSEDFRFEDCNVDEMDPLDGLPQRDNAGHGTHVAGLAAATTGNGLGVTGACWHCDLLIAKAFTQDDPKAQDPGIFVQAQIDRSVESLDHVLDQGAQIISMSFGVAEPGCGGNNQNNLNLFCQVIALADERDVVLTASAGNDRAAIEFPANDARVLSIGGIEFDPASPSGFSFWDDFPNCPFPQAPGIECGSNFGPEQDLAAPAKTVLSTVYAGFDHATIIPCGDSFLADPGYGPCTGTSMSSPYVAGIAGILRSVNPLLNKAAIRDALVTTASSAGDPNDQLGFGVPDAAAAARKFLGAARGKILRNRLTPLFSLFSGLDQTHVYTTSPQAASAFTFDLDAPFDSVGLPVAGYSGFPGVPPCQLSPCLTTPSAAVYLFTTAAVPFEGAPPLVPLFRLRYDPNLPDRCEQPPPPRIDNRDFSYTTEEAGIVHFMENVTDPMGIGYEFDGREGYVFQTCDPEPECIPQGAERLYRLYHPIRDDYAIFPESQLQEMLDEGYISQPGLADWIGYAYPNVDADGDELIDAFEELIGSDPLQFDTDCDGVGDGTEVLDYDLSDPDPANHGYRDPLDGPCFVNLFADAFESGDFSGWAFAGSK